MELVDLNFSLQSFFPARRVSLVLKELLWWLRSFHGIWEFHFFFFCNFLGAYRITLVLVQFPDLLLSFLDAWVVYQVLGGTFIMLVEFFLLVVECHNCWRSNFV